MLQKKLLKGIKVFLKNRKAKSHNMVENDIKIEYIKKASWVYKKILQNMEK